MKLTKTVQALIYLSLSLLGFVVGASMLHTVVEFVSLQEIELMGKVNFYLGLGVGASTCISLLGGFVFSFMGLNKIFNDSSSSIKWIRFLICIVEGIIILIIIWFILWSDPVIRSWGQM